MFVWFIVLDAVMFWHSFGAGRDSVLCWGWGINDSFLLGYGFLG